MCKHAEEMEKTEVPEWISTLRPFSINILQKHIYKQKKKKKIK